MPPLCSRAGIFGATWSNRPPHGRAPDTRSDLARYQLPVPIAVTTRRSIRLDLFASDRDRLLKFTAGSALLVRALARDCGRPFGWRACVGGILLSDPGSNIGGIERPMGRFTGSAAGSLIQRGADFPSDGGAEDRADCRRSVLAATLAKLVADNCAGCSANESTRGLVLAHPTATCEKHCQGDARADTDSATANRVCSRDHDVFPLSVSWCELDESRMAILCEGSQLSAPSAMPTLCSCPGPPASPHSNRYCGDCALWQHAPPPTETLARGARFPKITCLS